MKTQCTGEQLEFHALGRRSVKWAVLAVAVFLCAVALFGAVPRPVMLGVRVPTRSVWKYTVRDRPPASPRRVSARDASHRVGYGSVRGKRAFQAQGARTCIYGHLEERNAQRLSTSSLRRRLRLTLDDRVRPPHHPADNPVVSVQRA